MLDSNGINPTTRASSSYQNRNTMPYYEAVRQTVVRHWVPRAYTKILDVGCLDSTVLDDIVDTINRQYCPCLRNDVPLSAVALDVATMPRTKHTNVQADFMAWEGGKFNCVLCLQVLEHLINPSAFVMRLLNTVAPGGMLVVSVPYLWGPGCSEDHVQDPVGLSKLLGWFPHELVPDSLQIVKDVDTPFRRLVATFQSNLASYDPRPTLKL